MPKSDHEYVAAEFANKILQSRVPVSAGHDETDEAIEYAADRTASEIVEMAAIATKVWKKRNKRTDAPTADELLRMRRAIADFICEAARHQQLADARARTIAIDAKEIA